MNIEPSVIVRRSVEAMAPSRTSRTESTAVFIGRASFHMVPAVFAARAGDNTDVEAPVVVPEPQAISHDDDLTPAPVTGHPAVRSAAKPSDGVPAMRLFSADVTEPIQARPRAGRARRRLVNARTVRTILLALVAGATITLSAEAVMRRPATIDKFRSLAPRPPAPLAAAPASSASAPVPAPLAAATVVASTINDTRPAAAPATTDSAPSLAAARTAYKRSRSRSTAATRRASPLAGSTAAKSFAAWVDPFAAPETSASKRPTAWVDPFAN